MKTPVKWMIRILFILLVISLSASLRLLAVENLPVDYDEDDYLRAGQQYADGMRTGDWGVFTRENYRSEHPPLSKIIYGLALRALPPFPSIPDRPVTAGPDQSLPRAPLLVARLASAGINLLAVLVTAMINPLAGFFLGVHTFTIKYSSQVILEGVPTLTSLLVVVFYLLYRRSSRTRNAWLLLSALFLGLTVAAKYYYCIAGVAVLAHWIFELRQHESEIKHPPFFRRSAPILLWVVAALFFFVLADPYLWPDPLNRLWQSLTYHAGYAQSSQVQDANLPFWSPLTWLSINVPWHPGVFLIEIDLIISVFALTGIRRAWQRHPVYLLWLALGLGFLLVWPTKWPQYILLITAPLSIVAADGFAASVSEPLARRFSRPRETAAARKRLRWPLEAVPWLLPGALALALIMLFPLIFQLAIGMTDFQSGAIKDGINGGVWREVWLGLTGQVEAAQVNIFDSRGARSVSYTGPGALLSVLFGLGEFYVFEIIWTVLAVASQATLGVAVALLLHRRGLFLRKAWQVIFILPYAVPEFVAALAWSQIFDPRFGHLALAAKSWGQTAPLAAGNMTGWQDSPNTALFGLLVAALWYGFPIMLISALAGLKLIPPDVYDAAALDGATGWQLFRRVTGPLLLPLLVPALIVRSIFAFNQFYLFTVLPMPNITLSALSYFIFNDGRYAASATINIATVVILIILVAWFNRLTRAGEGVTYA